MQVVVEGVDVSRYTCIESNSEVIVSQQVAAQVIFEMNILVQIRMPGSAQLAGVHSLDQGTNQGVSSSPAQEYNITAIRKPPISYPRRLIDTRMRILVHRLTQGAVTLMKVQNLKYHLGK